MVDVITDIMPIIEYNFNFFSSQSFQQSYFYIYLEKGGIMYKVGLYGWFYTCYKGGHISNIFLPYADFYPVLSHSTMSLIS